MMQYNSFQRWTSSLLIFAILFSFTVQMPFFSILNRLFAADENYYNIVSLIVQEEIYPQIEASVKTYAQNIQNTLENTKTVIIPVPGDTHPYNIASINEKLYFDGYGAFIGKPDHSKLKGTVFIGNLALPVVENRGAFEKTVFPYVDFEDKLYIYDDTEQLFKYNNDVYKTPKAEIWHGFISPNTGDTRKDINQINAYFKKNNEYYNGEGIFANAGVMDGNDDVDLPSEYTPHVFYYDQIRETKAVQLVEYSMYNALHKYREELSYNHFSKEFAATLKTIYEQAQGKQIDLNMLKNIFGMDVGDITMPGGDNPMIPDIQMRHIIKSLRRPFLQVFSSGIVGEMRAHVHNAGRYNGIRGAVNVDLIPTIITNLDEISAMAIRNVNNDLEAMVDPIMKQISRDIAIPTRITKDTHWIALGRKRNESQTYTNYLYGTEAENIQEAMSCTIYRGSTEHGGTLVELNRAYNVLNSEIDQKACRDQTMGRWGGHTPLNLDPNAITGTTGMSLKLKDYDIRNAVAPIYDPQGAKKYVESEENPTPLNCLANNLILTKTGKNDNKNSCTAVREKLVAFDKVTFEDLLNKKGLLDTHLKDVTITHHIWLDGNPNPIVTHTTRESSSSGDEKSKTAEYNYHFKTIKSHFEHKTPNTDIIGPQVKNQISTNLPIDKVRYIDIIAADGKHARYDYPQIFDIELNDGSISLSAARASLKQELDKKSKALNDLIKAHKVDVSKLTDLERTIYTLLKKDSYYAGESIDFYKYFESLPDQEVTILGETKKVTYIDTLVFSIVWGGLDTVAGKYKFVFENYLSDQFNTSGQYENVFLPNHRKQYEIAYLGAPGDAQHMYIQMDPAGVKGENPYVDVLQNVQDINNLTFRNSSLSGDRNRGIGSGNTTIAGGSGNRPSASSTDGGGTIFRCAPPEGVPIWEWLPAVMCRIQDMLPPKMIFNTKTSKAPKYFVNREQILCDDCIAENVSEEKLHNDDANKNGIPDALENMRQKGSLHFVTDAKQYIHNTSGILEVAVLGENGKIIGADNLSQVTFQVTQIEDLVTKTKIPVNEETRHLVSQYINLRPISMPLSHGKRQYTFTTRGKDALITVEAVVTLGNNIPKQELNSPEDGIVMSQKKSLTFKISGERLQVSAKVLVKDKDGKESERFTAGVQASDKSNVFLGEKNASLGTSGSAKEKLFLTLDSRNSQGVSAPIAYPIEVTIRNEDGEYIGEKGKVVEKYSRKVSSLGSSINLASLSRAGLYTVEITDATGLKTKKQVTVLPDTDPENMKFEAKLSTNLVETDGVITNHVVTLLDRFDNLISGSPYVIEGRITGDAVTFENGKTTQEFQMFEGYKAFQLHSTATPGTAQITFLLKQGGTTLRTSQSVNITSVPEIKFDIVFPPSTVFKVGNNTYPFTLKVTQGSSTVHFHSKAFVTTNSNYVRGQDGYFSIENNVGEGTFSTRTTAGKKIKVEFQIEGVKTPLHKEIDILPEPAVKNHISLTKSKLKATNVADDPLGTTELFVELKDRYNNVVWTDNDTQINLEIRDEYKKILKADALTQKAHEGTATFALRSTSLPGVAFFKTSTTPDLAKNSIALGGTAPFNKGELDPIPELRKNNTLTPIGAKLFIEYDEKKYQFIPQTEDFLRGYFEGSNPEYKDFQALSPATKARVINLFKKHQNYTVPGYGENVGKIDTYYFWNPQKTGQHYNSLYTALLGSNYGDITQAGNVANAIIFDEKNSALGVTSLLSSTKKQTEVLGIGSDGRMNILEHNTNVALDIQEFVLVNTLGRFEVQLHDKTFGADIADTQIFLGKPNILGKCAGNDIAKCHPNGSEEPTIFATAQSGYRLDVNEVLGIELTNANGKPIFTLAPRGNITRSEASVTYELSNSKKAGLQLFVLDQGKRVATLEIFFPKSSQILPTRDANIPSFPHGGMLVQMKSKEYFYEPNYQGSSTKEKLGLSIVYNDPFASPRSTANQFGAQFEFGIERFEGQAGIGWQENNKIFLSFAAGKNIGQATQDFMSFGMINIGDPVAHLKTYRKELSGADKKRKYDSSIGLILSQDDDNLTYDVLDYNKDGNDDIIILKQGGYIQLLEGTGIFGDFLDRGNVVYIADMAPKSDMYAGDFTGDGYSDIVVLNKKKELVLLANTQKDFLRTKTNIKVDGAITQFLVKDMDEDGKDDIIVLDEGGVISVFYGTDKKGVFTKEVVDRGVLVELNSEEKREGGAVYYDGLYQMVPDDVLKNIADSSALLASQKNPTPGGDGKEVNEAIIDKMIYVPLAYTPHSKRGDPREASVNIPTPANPMNLYGANILNPSMVSQIPVNTGDVQPTGNVATTFMRSEYAQYDDLTVSKKYVDRNGGGLRSGDIVDYTLTITNNAPIARKDIAYAEKLHNLFALTPNAKTTLKIDGKEYTGSDILLAPATGADYTFVLDGYRKDGKEYPLELESGKTLTLSVEFATQPYSFGAISVGNFDTKDPLPDIMFKDSHESCGSGRTIYASQGRRSFQKGFGELSCPLSADSSNVPGQLDQHGEPVDFHRLDTDATYREEYTRYMYDQYFADRDGDGLPDFDDYAPGYNGETESFLDKLDSLNDRTDDLLGHIDMILAGLSCGFGGGGCIATPLNRAPLAPGNDPTLLGMPIGDGLKVEEGLPIFSALTWIGVGPLCIPMIWPISPLSTGCSGLGAGGRLGVDNPSNFIRVFITPTLTGAIGMAVCFGGPASVAGISNPMGLHPFVPGGNCVVAAMPLMGCKDDGSDGSIWEYSDDPDANFANGNCSKSNKAPNAFLSSMGGEFVQYRNHGRETTGFRDRLKDTFKTVADGNYRPLTPPDRPLINIGNGNNPDLEVNVDFGALANGNFPDVVDVSMRRISAFPDFIMEWVTRQIEEIANKLTDFPTLYIILPDFGGLFDAGWDDYVQGWDKIVDKSEEEFTEKENQINSQISALQSQEQTLCGTGKGADGARCLGVRSEILKLQATRTATTNKAVGGIKSVYEFISNLPLVNLEVQKVYLDIPWADQETIDRAIADFQATLAQRNHELERAQEQWTSGMCIDTVGGECKVIIDMQNLIYSLERNIEILESYARLPSDVYRMIKIKDIRMNQLMENVESIFQMVGGRVADNGIRFEAWVDLFILIKAILKSWQLLVDVFIDFDAECHECKNERYDLQYFIWKMISAAMPKIPIIRFPKWPDIILDLHNIRAQITVEVPEFEFNFRPIVLPTLPMLTLPDVPTVTVHLPELPLLPEVKLPTFPDLPMIPLPDLPNLPPPPKLPKLLGAIEMFLNVLKIITKVMCILKTSPFVPEWRAGDQIAFITERQGYMGFDFIDVSWPEFSYPWVDAIKITTYVNLEMRIDFLTEMARNAAMPLNIFGNNIANMLDISIGDIDLAGTLPSSLDIDLGNLLNGYTPLKDDAKIFDLASWGAQNITALHEGMEEAMNTPMSNEELREYIASQNISHPQLQGLWNQTLSYGFSEEKAFIQKLQDANTQKFDDIQSILLEEKMKNLELLEKLQENFAPENAVVLTQSGAKNTPQTQLETYREKAQTAAKNMFVDDGTSQELRQESDHILAQVNGQIGEFQKSMILTQDAIYTDIEESGILARVPEVPKNLFATGGASGATPPPSTITPQTSKSCPIPGSTEGNQPSFAYKGIYAIESHLGKKYSYYLFDYQEELDGKEIIKEFDADNDGDDDIVYMVGQTLYLKENFGQKKNTKKLITSAPLVIKKENNPMLTGKKFISSVNGFRESLSDNSFLNMSFFSKPGFNNYQIEFFPIVDKFDDAKLNRASYLPKNTKRHILDAFSDIYLTTKNREDAAGSIGTSRANLATLHSVQIPAGEHITMTTPSLQDISKDIESGIGVQLQANTAIYTGSQGATITYYRTRDSRKEVKNYDLSLPKRTNLEIKEAITVVGVQGKVYVENIDTFRELTGIEVEQQKGLPILPGTVITSRTKSATNAPKVVVQYYDGSETVVDFAKDASYTLYDLGTKQKENHIRLNIPNDFYYAKIRAFQNTLFSSYSEQVLLSPQLESDTTAPSIGNMPALRVPVYLKSMVDISDFIFEDSGTENIEDIYVDFDLTKDTDGDGNTINDRDYALDKDGSNPTPKFHIIKEGGKIFIHLGPFDKIMQKPIRIYVVDKNGNVGAKNVTFQVYSLVPRIQSVLDFKISGKLNEPRSNEPVGVYRLRNNTLERLETTANDYNIQSIEGGNFLFNTKGRTGEYLVITHTDENTKKTDTLMKVNESTGRIEIEPIGRSKYHLQIKVNYDDIPKTAGGNGYPQISVLQGNTPVYYEYLATPNAGKVEEVQSFTEVTSDLGAKIGVYYLHENAFEYTPVTLPLGIEKNAGDLYIYNNSDANKEAVVTIAKDGRIQLYDSSLTLEYSMQPGYAPYVVYELKRNNKLIGSIMIIPEENYIITGE